LRLRLPVHHLGGERDVVLGRLRLERFGGLLPEHVERVRACVEREAPGVDAREVEQVSNEPIHTLDATMNDLRLALQAALGVGHLERALQQISHRRDRSEGRPQVMAHDGQDLLSMASRSPRVLEQAFDTSIVVFDELGRRLLRRVINPAEV
jgi:hypothetical protein